MNLFWPQSIVVQAVLKFHMRSKAHTGPRHQEAGLSHNPFDFWVPCRLRTKHPRTNLFFTISEELDVTKSNVKKATELPRVTLICPTLIKLQLAFAVFLDRKFSSPNYVISI